MPTRGRKQIAAVYIRGVHPANVAAPKGLEMVMELANRHNVVNPSLEDQRRDGPGEHAVNDRYWARV